MPIKGLTDRKKLKVIARVYGGRKQRNERGVEYPVQEPYFVVRPDEFTPVELADAFHEINGEKPTQITIVVPTDDETQFADVNMRMYSSGWGQVCRGSGLDGGENLGAAMAKWDLGRDGPRPDGVDAGTWASRDTKAWISREIPCMGRACPMQTGDRPSCKMVMTLQFLLPDVPGIGVWQLSTSSWHSVRSILDSIETIKAVTGGRIRGIPLLLRRVPKDVVPPDGKTKKKTVYVYDLTLPSISINALLKEAARLPETGLFLPSPYEGATSDAPVDDDDDDPETVVVNGQRIDIATGEALNAIATGEAMTAKEAPPAGIPALANIGSLLTWAWNDCRLKSGDVCTVLGVDTTDQINDLPDAYEKIRQHMEGKQASLSVP